MATLEINRKIVKKRAIGIFWRKAKDTEPRLSARTAAAELGLPKIRRVRKASTELAFLKKHRPDLAESYRKAARSCKGNNIDDFLRSASRKADEIQIQGRKAVYEKLGIELVPLSKKLREKTGFVEPVESRALFEMIAYGGLKENVLEMAGIAGACNVRIERIYSGTEVYRATVEKDGQMKSVYIKETNVEPDIFAAKKLEEHGYVVPSMSCVQFRAPHLGRMQYGILQNIRDAEGVRDAVSVRAIARSPEFAGYVWENFPEFIEMLGYFFETCRKLGIQDRHDRNIYLIRREDGSIGIGTIDIDFVACYSEKRESQKAFAGQIYRILDSLYFSLYYSEDVMADPGGIRCLLEKREVPLNSWKRKVELCKKISAPFLAGAQGAHEFYLEERNAEAIKQWLRSYDRRYIGWGVGQDRIHRLTIRRDETEMNGKKHKLIKKGPNRGRIKLDWKMAWKHGFLKATAGDVPGFWQGTFDLWSWKLFDWIRDAPRGKLQHVSTVAY